jgi:virginiamycin B lyase
VVTRLRLVVTATFVAAACAHPATSGSEAAVPQAGIFWAQSPRGTDEERGSVGRANVDGSAASPQFISAAKAPAGVAADGTYVYWSNYGSGTIARAKLDGSGVNNRFITGVDDPVGVAVDSAHIYWTSSGLDPNSGTIGRANLDGSGVNRRFIRAGDSPIGLAVDDAHIYWTHRRWNGRSGYGSDAIGRANLDGSGVDRYFVVAANKLDGVAVNASYLLWSNSGEHTIGRANLDGTDVDQRCLTPTHVPLENVPEGLAVDAEHVYWTNYPANTIGRANLDGSGVDSRFIVANGVPEGIAVAWDRAAAPSAPTRACVGPSSAPILFGTRRYLPGYYATGWAEVAPPTISNGGAAASGTIFQIHWRSWGGRVAVGRGLNATYTPHGGYYRRPVVIELRASRIRSCGPAGRRVYTRFVVREQVRPGGPMGKWFTWARNMCGSYFAEQADISRG